MTAVPITPIISPDERRRHAQNLPQIFQQLDLCTTCYQIREDCAGHEPEAVEWCDEHAMPLESCDCSTRYAPPVLNLADVLLKPSPPEDWILWPFVERGQQAALYSEAKAGKSLITFELAIAAANGRPYLGRPAAAPIRVLYVDAENTTKDLKGRMSAFHAEAGDFDNIAYVSFPQMHALTTVKGGQQMIDLVDQHTPDLVIIDTISRFIDGPENDSDTWLALYRNTLLRLKGRGVAVLRLDHTGKDHDRGARGSSAKSSDIDAEWSLVHDKVKDERTLKRVRSRGSNGPDRLVLAIESEPLRHEVLGRQLKDADPVSWLAGKLDALEVEPGTGRVAAGKILNQHGIDEFTDRQLRDAVTLRREVGYAPDQDALQGI